MKKLLLLLLAACLLLGGCATSAPTDSTSSTDKLFESGVNGIRLGLSAAQLLDTLNAKGIGLVMPDYISSPHPDEAADAPLDGRIYNMTNLSFYYTTDNGMFLTCDADGILVTISGGSNVTTDEGIGVGSSIADMKNIYGSDCTEYADEPGVYQYSNGDAYLTFRTENDQITFWFMSSYYNINND